MDLKKLLGDKYSDDLTAEQKLELLSALNLADLSSGEYVAKGKFDAKEQELAKLTQTVADYQAKEKAALSDEQKKALEVQEMLAQKEALEKELSDFRLKEAIMKSGYTSEECEKIITAQKDGKDTSTVYAEIMQARIEEGVKSAKAEMFKNGTPPPPQGSTGGDESDFDNDPILQMVSEAAKGNLNNLQQLEAIKDSYSIE